MPPEAAASDRGSSTRSGGTPRGPRIRGPGRLCPAGTMAGRRPALRGFPSDAVTSDSLRLRIPRLTGPVSPTAGAISVWGWHAVPANSRDAADARGPAEPCLNAGCPSLRGVSRVVVLDARPFLGRPPQTLCLRDNEPPTRWSRSPNRKLEAVAAPEPGRPSARVPADPRTHSHLPKAGSRAVRVPAQTVTFCGHRIPPLRGSGLRPDPDRTRSGFRVGSADPRSGNHAGQARAWPPHGPYQGRIRSVLVQKGPAVTRHKDKEKSGSLRSTQPTADGSGGAADGGGTATFGIGRRATRSSNRSRRRVRILRGVVPRASGSSWPGGRCGWQGSGGRTGFGSPSGLHAVCRSSGFGPF